LNIVFIYPDYLIFLLDIIIQSYDYLYCNANKINSNLKTMKKSILFSCAILLVAFGIYSFTQETGIKPKKNKKEEIMKKVCINTSYGDIKIKLYNETPLHRDNFIKLAKEAYFDSTLFNRIIKEFMIQGGDPKSKNADSTTMLGNGGPDYTIPAEILLDSIDISGRKFPVVKLYHKKGALGAARDNNPAKASSGSQFYIVQGRVFTEYELQRLSQQTGNSYTPEQIKTYTTIGGTPHLDFNYTVFGEVYEGLDVVEKISLAKTGPYDRPAKDIKMSIKVIEE